MQGPGAGGGGGEKRAKPLLRQRHALTAAGAALATEFGPPTRPAGCQRAARNPPGGPWAARARAIGAMIRSCEENKRNCTADTVLEGRRQAARQGRRQYRGACIARDSITDCSQAAAGFAERLPGIRAALRGNQKQCAWMLRPALCAGQLPRPCVVTLRPARAGHALQSSPPHLCCARNTHWCGAV